MFLFLFNKQEVKTVIKHILVSFSKKKNKKLRTRNMKQETRNREQECYQTDPNVFISFPYFKPICWVFLFPYILVFILDRNDPSRIVYNYNWVKLSWFIHVIISNSSNTTNSLGFIRLFFQPMEMSKLNIV